MRVHLKLLTALFRETNDEAFIRRHLPNTKATAADVAAARKAITEIIETLCDITQQTMPAQQDPDPIDATLPLPEAAAASESVDERTKRLKKRTGTKRSEGNPDIEDDIDRYATLTAWMRHFPERGIALLAENGLNPSSWEAFRDLMEQAMARDPKLRALYDERLKLHVSYIV